MPPSSQPPFPNIFKEIGGEMRYVRITNAFFIAATVLQPLFAQLAKIFGRKIPMLTCLVLFMLGGGLASGSKNPGMFITGPTIQGKGSGGIYALINIVCCDVVALRDRGKYMGIINAWAGIASGLGPVMGGAFGNVNWSWIFYINLHIFAVPLVTIFFLMRIETGQSDAQSGKGVGRRTRQLHFCSQHDINPV